jgi:predicted nucleic acid-binding protein
MAERIVLHAAVALALLRPGDAAAAVRAALQSWIAADAALVVPAIFWIDVVEALGVRDRRPGVGVVEALHVLDELGLETVDADRPTHLLLADAAERHGLGAHDASYLVLAELLGAPLATLDRRLADAAGAIGLLIGEDASVTGRPLRDRRAPNGRRSSLPDYGGFGAYLGELRRRAAAEAG